MVLIKNDPRKEATYGWYPAGTNVYQPKNAPRSYNKEYLFKSFDRRSRPAPPKTAWSAEGVAARPTASGLHLDASQSPPLLAVTGCKPPTLASVAAVAEHSRPPRAFSAAAAAASLSGSDAERARSGRPHGSAVAASDPRMPPIPTPSRSEMGLVSCPSSESISIPSTPANEDEPRAVHVRTRAKSAVELRRDCPTAAAAAQQVAERRQRRPKTSVATGSAQSSRRQHGSADEDAEGGAFFATPQPSRPAARADEVDEVRSTSHIRSPPAFAVELAGRGHLTPPTAAAAAAAVPSYDDQLSRYGWRAEIPGDPLKLKVITQRLSYAVSCEDPAVRPNPPDVCVMDNSTFFYNTIPRRLMSFTVHPEWQSELFVAKRIDLERRGVAKFHTRNFAFAY